MLSEEQEVKHGVLMRWCAGADQAEAHGVKEAAVLINVFHGLL